MSEASSTGSFWLCPQCHKHVSTRRNVCQCGVDRTSLPVKVHEVSLPSEDARPSPRWGVLAMAGTLVVACAGLLFVGVTSWDAPSTGPPRKLRLVQDQPPPPSIVYVPIPLGSPMPPLSPEPTGSTRPENAPGQAQQQRGGPEPGLAMQVPQVEEERESDTDRLRRIGKAEFERAVASLAVKADQADIAWHRYIEGCHLDVTTASAGAVAGGRDWFVAAWASTTTSRLSAACAESGTFYALVDQVRIGMCTA